MEIFETSLQVIRFFSIVYGQNKEVDEPGQGVLVHRFNIGQVSNGEEQDRGMNSYWGVSHSGCVDLLFCVFSNGL